MSLRKNGEFLTSNFVRDQASEGLFKVSREAFVSKSILDLERERIFDRCWLYLGHSSELPDPNRFLTREVGGRPLIFNRDRAGEFRAYFNTCPHRGALLERRPCGKSMGFKCFYHGWSFRNDGVFATKDVKKSYPANFGADGSNDLVRVPRLEQYQGFWFINFDAGAIGLEDYLADVRGIIDLIVDQSPSGVEVIKGSHEYSIDANWKLLAENSYDSYHALETHSTYFNYLKTSLGVDRISPPKQSSAFDLGNGHATIESEAPWGRPVARWVPSFGDAAIADFQAIEQEVTERVGVDRAERILRRDRNMVIFPNLVLNDNIGLIIRTFYPCSPGSMRVDSWALGAVGEGSVARKRRLDNFLEFLGPGGFATPDDATALESAQRGYQNAKFAGWNDISRGVLKAHPAKDDEHQMRTWWRQWARLMERSDD